MKPIDAFNALQLAQRAGADVSGICRGTILQADQTRGKAEREAQAPATDQCETLIVPMPKDGVGVWCKHDQSGCPKNLSQSYYPRKMDFLPRGASLWYNVQYYSVVEK